MRFTKIFFLRFLGYFIAFLIIGIIQFFTVGAIVFSNTDFFGPCGESCLDLPKTDTQMAFSFIILFTIEILIWFGLWKASEIPKAFKWNLLGIILPIIIPTFFGTYEVISTDYYEEFNEKEWKTASLKSIKMVRTIVKSRMLDNMSKKDVIDLLGEGNKSWYVDSNELDYSTSCYATHMSISFKKDTVDRISFPCFD